MFLGFTLAFLANTKKETPESQGFKVMETENPEVYTFLNIGIKLFGINTAVNLLFSFGTTVSTYKCFSRLSLILGLVRIAVTCYGIHFVWAENSINNMIKGEGDYSSEEL